MLKMGNGKTPMKICCKKIKVVLVRERRDILNFSANPMYSENVNMAVIT